MAAKIKERLYGMEEINRRNNDRAIEYSVNAFMEPHMRERLSEIRNRKIHPQNEWIRQQIIERYEHDLATYVRG